MPQKAIRRAQPEQNLGPKDADSDVDSTIEDESSPSYENAVNLPAHQTKHLPELVYRFPSIDTSLKIVQRNDTNSTGSSLWLSSQVLSSYLLHTYATGQQGYTQGSCRRVLELGSGTGLLSLLMARLGWQAVATDIPPVLESVLKPNVEAGLYQLINHNKATESQVRVCELDWTVSPESWHWHPSLGFPSTQNHAEQCRTGSNLDAEQRFDLILTADTIYEPSLVKPLLSAIAYLYRRQTDSKPTILLALERRDPTHVSEALRLVREEFELPFKQIPVKRVRKIFDTLGDGATWPREDWDGVEIWKF